MRLSAPQVYLGARVGSAAPPSLAHCAGRLADVTSALPPYIGGGRLLVVGKAAAVHKASEFGGRL
jgi:hypothetical protein